jgi:signal transduction histidine kinase
MKARPTAAGLIRGAAHPGAPTAAGGSDEPVSARVAEARSRARERGDQQRQALRPLGLAFIAVVVILSVRTHPAPGLYGTGLAVTLVLAAYAAAVLTAVSIGWAHRGLAAQVAVIGLIGGCGVALAALQPQGVAVLAPSLGVWFAAVRLPPVPAAATAGAITAALSVAIGLTEHPAAVFPAVLLCLLLAVVGQFLRRGRESQDRIELLMAQLEDARDAETAAAALAERTRIAGELHDVLAHSLSALAIQLQGARKLAGREQVSDGLRATIERSAELTKSGLADARQAVGALRGDRLPTLDQLSALVDDFRRDTGADATLRIDGTVRAVPAEASLALYRGAQEALTNISRYAPGAVTSVTVSYRPDRTVVTVEDRVCRSPADLGPAAGAQSPAEPAAAADPRSALPAAADAAAGPRSALPVAVEAGADSRSALLAEAGGGHGLAAMRERAQRAGGTARAGPTTDGWLVELEVPA